MKSNKHIFLKEIVKELPEKIESISDYLFLANLSVAVQETLYFKIKQINRDEYNWLTENMVSRCKDRLENIIGSECINIIPRIEETIIHQSDDEAHKRIDEFLAPHFEINTKFRFTARTDLITEKSVWELKCTTKISIDHLLQVVIYAWLWRMKCSLTNEENKEFKIFNIRTNELLRMEASMEELNTIMLALLKGKFQVNNMKTDEEFIHDCREYLNNLTE